MTISPTAYREVAEDSIVSSENLRIKLRPRQSISWYGPRFSLCTACITEVHPANQMAGSCDFGYTLVRWPWFCCAIVYQHGINEGKPRIREKLGKSWACYWSSLLPFSVAYTVNSRDVERTLWSCFGRRKEMCVEQQCQQRESTKLRNLKAAFSSRLVSYLAITI